MAFTNLDESIHAIQYRGDSLMTRRTLGYVYGFAAYLLALSTIVYAVGFLANVYVPKSIDSGTVVSLSEALLIDVTLIGLFGLQHSMMARPWFKERWTRFIPEPVERSTYVLLASLTIIVMMWAWKPLPKAIWHVNGVGTPLLWTLNLGGWLLMFASVYMIDKDDLMGLRQVKAYRRGEELEPIGFQTPAFYRYVRHPLMTGFLLAFWATPRMTVGHLVFAGGMTVYVLVGVTLEERDLVVAFGDRYREYRADVPMLIPRPGRTISRPVDDSDGTSK